MLTLPFLTAPDPATTGEGVLDPLGLSALGDKLAEEILPGLRARMSRVRFLTAITVSAAVCEGLEEELAADKVSPAYIVFEWLVVEGLVRAGNKEATKGTPGTLKAQAAKESGEPLCAASYLRIPTIFGFHGVYKPLARDLGLVDDEFRLGDNGYALLKTWETEQKLKGFLESPIQDGEGTVVRKLLRSAVEDSMHLACSDRKPGWQGWQIIADHLSPGQIGRAESSFLYRLLMDPRGGTRGEVFDRLRKLPTNDDPESDFVRQLLDATPSADLTNRLRAIKEFENVAGLLEDAFDWIRYLSSTAGARPIKAEDYSRESAIKNVCDSLKRAFSRANAALASSPAAIQTEFESLYSYFHSADSPEDLFESVLRRHHDVQHAKKPDGKRDWFERGADGATFVRVPYRTTKPIQKRDWWNRPYRIDAARSFITDLKLERYLTAHAK